MLSPVHYTSIIITLVLVSAAGVYTARYVKTAADFTVGGRRIGALLVSGSLIGGFVGGTCTIGTAQMAYRYGLCGIWFTIGAGISCVLIAALARQLREKQVETIPQYLAAVYGENIAPWVAVYTSAGTFIQVGAQVLSAVPIITAISGLNPARAAVAVTALIVMYVIFGGFWSASFVGFIKLVVLYVSMTAAGIMAFTYINDMTGLQAAVPSGDFLTFFGRGVGKEAAGVFSVIIGFASTQAYLQPLFAASGLKAARRGVLLAGLLIPVMGVLATAIGMYMRLERPGINAASALPEFIFNYLPDWLGGIAIAILLISLVLTGASLTLGISTMLVRDIYSRLRRARDEKEVLLASRVLVFLIGCGALIMVATNVRSLILEWAFLSMALRGVTVFIPLAAAIFFIHRVNRKLVRASVALAPFLTIVWALFFPGGIDPLYTGLVISAALIIPGIQAGRN